MRIISTILMVMIIILFFIVPGTWGERTEQELLFGFRILAGFVILAGCLRVIITQFNRIKAGRNQKLLGTGILVATFILLVSMFIFSFFKINFAYLVVDTLAIPLWTSFTAIAGLSFTVAIIRSIRVKRWETFFMAGVVLFYLISMTLPAFITQLHPVNRSSLTILNISRILFRYIFTGALKGFLFSFFLLILIQKLRILFYREKRKDEFIA
jgi:hypothetical protein